MVVFYEVFMSLLARLDERYISLIYSNEVVDITRSVRPNIYQNETESTIRQRVISNLASTLHACIHTLKEELQKERNFANLKVSFDKNHGSYTAHEDIVRKIFFDIFAIRLEQSDLYQIVKSSS